jgi:hypothetical protein
MCPVFFRRRCSLSHIAGKTYCRFFQRRVCIGIARREGRSGCPEASYAKGKRTDGGGRIYHLALSAKWGFIEVRYCNVTSTIIVPFPLGSGSSAFPTTAPSIRFRFVPFIA